MTERMCLVHLQPHRRLVTPTLKGRCTEEVDTAHSNNIGLSDREGLMEEDMGKECTKRGIGTV